MQLPTGKCMLSGFICAGSLSLIMLLSASLAGAASCPPNTVAVDGQCLNKAQIEELKKKQEQQRQLQQQNAAKQAVHDERMKQVAKEREDALRQQSAQQKQQQLAPTKANPVAGATAQLPGYSYTSPEYKNNPGGRGYCSPQCAEFVRYNLGVSSPGMYAKMYWSSPPKGYKQYPQGSKRAPRPGDMLVWKGELNVNDPKLIKICGGKVGGCGHVAIVKSVNLTKGTLTRVDANWLGSCKVVEHDKMTVSGDDKRGYTIAGEDSNYLYGWLSK